MTAPTIVRQRLPILGMDCADCAKTLERALGETDGVVSADVRFELGTAVVAYDDTQTNPARLARVVERAGYRVANEASAAAPSCNLTFDVQGMDCADCARSAQMAVSRLNGVRSADVQFETGILKIEASDASLDPGVVIRAVESAGYKAVLREGQRSARTHASLWSDRRVHELAGATVLWVLGMIAEHGLDIRPLAIALYLAAMVLAGFRIARAARVSLSVRRADMNLLMTMAAVGAVILGDFSEASSLVVLFSIGIWLQSATLDRTRGAIASLLDMAPTTARLIRGDQDVSIPAADVKTGDVVRVLP
ncbi:MAG TPA: copper ion binding protein, partial [Thermomicrobiales bacterium]|nr:copper ion binding protein [Thermomicrobiales bacterium]